MWQRRRERPTSPLLFYPQPHNDPLPFFIFTTLCVGSPAFIVADCSLLVFSPLSSFQFYSHIHLACFPPAHFPPPHCTSLHVCIYASPHFLRVLSVFIDLCVLFLSDTLSVLDTLSFLACPPPPSLSPVFVDCFVSVGVVLVCFSPCASLLRVP